MKITHNPVMPMYEETTEYDCSNVNTLREALVIMQSLYGKTIVILYRDSINKNNESLHAFVNDLILLKQLGCKLVILHENTTQLADVIQLQGGLSIVLKLLCNSAIFTNLTVITLNLLPLLNTEQIIPIIELAEMNPDTQNTAQVASEVASTLSAGYILHVEDGMMSIAQDTDYCFLLQPDTHIADNLMEPVRYKVLFSALANAIQKTEMEAISADGSVPFQPRLHQINHGLKLIG